MSPASYSSNVKMLVTLILGFIGLYASTLLLSPGMKDPAIDMMMASKIFSGGHSPVWPQASVKAINPMIAHPGYGAIRGAHTTRPVVVRAESETLARLEEAIKSARECAKSGTPQECMVQWDIVEELSAAIAHSKPQAEKIKQVPAEDMQKLKTIMQSFAAAREMVPKESKQKMDVQTVAKLQAVLDEKQEVVTKVASERLERFDAKIQEAKEAAKASGNAVDWDIVEELMQERSHLIKFGGSN
eukprot:gnl/MRDRNA2_/MRDRNA2_84240_c0_seq1.p1 gnl/MRDRNA2_/MRDRNA2_84240_c0~~gnl/MRDRNA2_/MRDRNA2_84240_c0_seq1.p1  ORF type:complete len:279 (+),score=79.13 gnl/MRDRNA2_/MRDRNA2_84240_c0_seq1:108-839(+)